MSRIKDTVLAATLALSVANFAWAQIGTGSMANVATKDDLTALAAIVPTALGSVPPQDTNAGSVGSAGTYVPGNATRQARYRSGSCVIAGGAGQCTVPWSTSFPVTPNPLGDPAPLNGSFSTMQLQCNWISISSSNAVVGCRQLTLLGVVWSLLGNGVTVYATAVQPL